MAKALRKDELKNPTEEQGRPRLSLAHHQETVDSRWKTVIDEVDLSPEEVALAEAGAETQAIPRELLDEDNNPLTPEKDLLELLSGDKKPKPTQGVVSIMDKRMPPNGQATEPPPASLLDMTEKWSERGKEIKRELTALEERKEEIRRELTALEERNNVLLTEKARHLEIGQTVMSKLQEIMKEEV